MKYLLAVQAGKKSQMSSIRLWEKQQEYTIKYIKVKLFPKEKTQMKLSFVVYSLILCFNLPKTVFIRPI